MENAEKRQEINTMVNESVVISKNKIINDFKKGNIVIPVERLDEIAENIIKELQNAGYIEADAYTNFAKNLIKKSIK